MNSRIQSRQSRVLRAIAAVVAVSGLSARGMMFIDYSSSAHNTTAPTGVYEESGWQWTGGWGAVTATVVSPTQVVTIDHLASRPTSFSYGGNSYPVQAYHKNGDVLLVDLDTSIHGDFTSWATLYPTANEVGNDIVVIGNGFPRGSEVIVDSELKGWGYSGSGKARRWGTNTVEAVVGSSGQYLAFTFDAGAGKTAHEAHLTGGDSGGGVFIQDGDGVWKLAAINYTVDAYFNTAPQDSGRFTAALFDMGGLYIGSGTSWTYIGNQPYDIPSAFYSHRITYYSDWLNDLLVFPTEIPEPSSLALLLTAVALVCNRRRISACGSAVR